MCIYSVKEKNRINNSNDEETFGMLFVAGIFSFDELHSEIEEIFVTDTLIKDWTYPFIQPKLIEEAKNRGII